jgi:outer membrane protein TolC
MIFICPGKVFSSEPLIFNNSDEVIGFAIANSKDLNFQKILSLEGMKREKWNIRSFLPAITLSYSQNDNISLYAPDTRNKSINASATQLIFDGGKTFLEHELAKINALFTYQNYEKNVENFALKIEEMFRELVLYKKSLEIKKNVYSNALKRKDILSKQYELGQITRSDFFDYEISVLELYLDLQKFGRNLQESYRNLKNYIGMNPEMGLEISDTGMNETIIIKKISENFEDLYLIYANSNLDLKSQRINFEYQKKMERLNLIQTLPNISLQCSMDFSGKAFPLTEPSFMVKLIFSMNNDIFPMNYSPSMNLEIGRINGTGENMDVTVLPSSTFVSDRRIAKIQTEQSMWELTESEKNLKENFRRLLYAHDDLIDDLDVQTKLLNAMEKKLNIEEIRAKNGEIKELDLLDAQIEFANCEIRIEELKNQILLARKNLKIQLNGYEI